MTAGPRSLQEALVQEMPWYVSAAVRFQMAVADQMGMPLADVHAVGALLEVGPTGVRQLAEVMGMTTGAVTRLVDRLEGGGFVRRDPDPTDRRRVVLRVVPERVEAISRYYESMGDRWRRTVDGYSDAELRFLLDFLRSGRADAQAETARLRADGRRHGARKRRATGGDAATPD
ncbi:MAG: MarR family transcriptional regulator [Streptosporangiales bacterium]|nr:MarR family transcriptional regulator [Streptosporangiales bacterium]